MAIQYDGGASHDIYQNTMLTTLLFRVLHHLAGTVVLGS
jgi:hypothetical protein